MGLETDFIRLLDHAPKVDCARCSLDMPLRTLVPKSDKQNYTATYRCAKCGTETQREFTVPL
jgi:transposase-like protein